MSLNTMVDPVLEIDYPHRALKNKGIVDSGCSRHMTGNKAYLAEFQDFNGGPVAFRGSKGYITGKGKIKTGKLDSEDVCFVKELQHFNLFSMSQMCDKKNKVLFTDSECLVLSPEFKLPNENQEIGLFNSKATLDENLTNGIGGKQHKASCKAKSVSSISHSLQLLHMDLFGPTSVRSLNHKTYCLVITDDFSRFSWVFFLRAKDETSTGGCQFLGRRLISWQCKKQTIVATSTTEAEYVAVASVVNPVYHSKTKHIAIRHHFIRDAYEKKLIQVLKIHTDDNVVDLLTKAFDVSSVKVMDGTEALLLPTLFIPWLDTVSTDSAKLVSLGKVCTAIETLKKNTAKALISLLTTITLSTTMVVLDSCPKHNMVAYLEKTKGNAEFHEIIDFLTRSFHSSSSLHITAKVAGKPVSISEASIRSDLLFDDANGIDSLPNQAIFNVIQLMGYEGDLTMISMGEFTFFLGLQVKQKADGILISQDKYVAEILKNFDFATVKTASTPIETQKPLVKDEEANDVDVHLYRYMIFVSLCLSLCAQVSDQAKEIQHLKAQIKKLKKQAKPVIHHHRAWLKSVSLKQRLTRKSFPKKQRVHKESVSKQGRKFAKGEPSVQRDPLFDELPEDTVDHMETENAQDVGRTREIVDEEKELDEDILSTEDVLSTDKEKVSTDRPIVSTDGSKVSTDRQVEGTDEQNEGTEEQIESTDGQRKGTEDHTEEGSATQATQTPTSTIFGDDETIAKVLLNMSQAKAVSREKEKGVELKDIEETDRPRPTSTRSLLTLKPLPKIDPKDKGKKKIEEEDESESESDGIPEAEKKFKQLESDEEMARKIQEEWEGEEERNRIAEEKATNEALIRNFDDIKARIEADRLLAEKLQEQEREQFTIEERAKFLHDTIVAQIKFLAQQRSEAIRNRPPTKNQLRNQMMTYLKHVGNFKHSELKVKKFEEIQVLYKKIKRSNEDFISIGSAEDERLIKKINEKGVDSSKSEVIKEENKEEVKEENKEEVQKESKEEESTRKRKLGTRKKMKSRKRRFIQNTSDDDSEKENDELRLHLTIVPDEEKEVDYKILDRKYPIKEWKTECLGTKPQTDKAEDLEEINQNVVIRSNGQKRYFSTLMRVLSIFDREDLNAVFQLVMDKFQDEIPEGFNRVLWGDLMVISSGVHTLVTEGGLVIHMLVEKKYPLKKEVLVQMLKLKLGSEEDSTMALELIRFIKKLLGELEPKE
ncbi:putative ribonuclease H-like domain-containing protein [Tanacetum coccineum]